jgi:hypothetical protein
MELLNVNYYMRWLHKIAKTSLYVNLLLNINEESCRHLSLQAQRYSDVMQRKEIIFVRSTRCTESLLATCVPMVSPIQVLTKNKTA